MFTKTRPIEQRFWSKVTKGFGNACWIWTAGTDGRGYGMLWDNKYKRDRRATQISWELHNKKPFPKDKDACHTCDNPPCVNPEHIWPGTAKENALDAKSKGRLNSKPPCGWQRKLTHCKRGHEFSPENTIITSRGNRACRSCKHMHQRVYDRKRRAKG